MIDPKEGLYEHAEFLGLRNNVPADRFALGDLTAATNVDIDDAKRIARRTGYSAAVLAGAYKSVWSNGAVALAVRSETELIGISPAYVASVLRSGLTPGLDMSYTAPAGAVYYSNGLETGVVQDGRSRSWGLTVPTVPVATETGGVLPAGLYQYAVAYRRADGQISGTLRAGVIALTLGGLQLSDISVSSDPDVVDKLVYCSRADGDTLYLVGVLPAATTTFSYRLYSDATVVLQTQHLLPAPAGQLVDSFSGRTLVAAGGTLYYSEPYAPELFDLRKNYRLGAHITVLAALDDGVYVGTETQLLWMGGAVPEKWDVTPKLSYGAIRGTSAVCSRDMIDDGASDEFCAFFATTQGLCIGLGDGTVTNLTQSRFSYPIQERGAAVVRRHRGMTQGLVALQGVETAGNVAS